MSKHWALRNIWKLEPLQIAQLDKYYLLHWKPTHFLREIIVQDKAMFIHHQGVQYELILRDARLNDFILDKDVRLSFRKHKEESTGVVLVSRNQNECPNHS